MHKLFELSVQRQSMIWSMSVNRYFLSVDRSLLNKNRRILSGFLATFTCRNVAGKCISCLCLACNACTLMSLM